MTAEEQDKYFSNVLNALLQSKKADELNAERSL